ncbi:MAG: NADH-quinone oxidoreductase subunit A [Abitibacteriaceae bacterium]|nr:NADH-quinone oxidoreductase subunit A [Abditibacteriaceae bacterium]MBV9864502.1 NADH-quinone oxidoreductase subunit A [Abditibacteriaceae bacterium]
MNISTQSGLLPILILLVLGGGFGVVVIILSKLLGPRRPSTVKNQSYECGIDPVGDARLRFSVKFYIIAMLFILFDIEAIFLYPWAVLFQQLRLFGLAEMLVFLGFLVLGYIYLWRRGALEWD